MSPVSQPAFRRALPEDAEAVRTLVRAAYAKWVPIIGREPRPMVADYSAAIDNHDIDLLIEDGAPIALIETVVHPDHLWIENIAVSPANQGRGHGKRLLAFADQKAIGLAVPEVRLLTNEAFASNIALYQRCGFVIDRKEPFHLGGVTVYMRKSMTH